MSDQTPAEQLHAAAQALRNVATAARYEMKTGSYWRGLDPTTAWERGITNAVGGHAGGLAALMSPEAALALADWLDALAAEHPHEVFPARPPCGPDCEGHEGFVMCLRCARGFEPCAAIQPALAVARQILGSPS